MFCCQHFYPFEYFFRTFKFTIVQERFPISNALFSKLSPATPICPMICFLLHSVVRNLVCCHAVFSILYELVRCNGLHLPDQFRNRCRTLLCLCMKSDWLLRYRPAPGVRARKRSAGCSYRVLPADCSAGKVRFVFHYMHYIPGYLSLHGLDVFLYSVSMS